MADLTGTLSNASLAQSVADAAQPHLFLVLSRTSLVSGGARHSLANIQRVTLGRGSERSAKRVFEQGKATLVLTLADRRMSGVHASLERGDEGAWTLIDHGSTNGSRVNHVSTRTSPLHDGDWIELGETLFRFRTSVPTPATAPGDLSASALSGMAAAFSTTMPWLVRDLETVSRIARSDVAALLLGETGTGKEVLARAIHAESGRKGAFVAVNCGALPATLVEALLFGHKKGAFSGANQDEPGLVRAADGGTLFLDEVGDLPAPSQAALLRVLQEREVVPVGSTRAYPVDFRVVAATHRPLEALTESGAFRSDLLSRLSAFTYFMPPLRERMEDMGTLIAALLRKSQDGEANALGLGAGAARELLEHSWPLNVRELEQCLKVGRVLAENQRIERLNLRRAEPAQSEPASEAEPEAPRAPLTPDEQELHDHLVEQLKAHHGNVTHVGKAMGKARSQVQRWLRRFAIDPLKFR